MEIHGVVCVNKLDLRNHTSVVHYPRKLSSETLGGRRQCDRTSRLIQNIFEFGPSSISH